MDDQLKNIVCLNKGQSLDELGLKVVDKERYASSLKNFCEGNWTIHDCFQSYDPQTGEHGDSKLCT